MIAAWFDPGLLTGVCVYDFDLDRLLVLDEFDIYNTVGIIDRDDEGHGQLPLLPGTEIMIGWESYRIMKGAQTQAPWSLEVIGALRYISTKHGYTLLKPAEPKAREVATPAMLRNIGWYSMCRGKKDALSAAQHMVSWMLRENMLPERYRDAIIGPLR